MGSTSTAPYTRIGRRPQQGRLLSSVPPYSGILTRSLSVPWRPAMYYQTARVDSTQPFSSQNYLNNINNARVPLIFPSARLALCTRYTPKDWHDAQMTNYSASNQICAAAERLRSDAIRLAREIYFV
ncbi:unnamed protein product, partial [Rotaria sp. Silwood2]